MDSFRSLILETNVESVKTRAQQEFGEEIHVSRTVISLPQHRYHLFPNTVTNYITRVNTKVVLVGGKSLALALSTCILLKPMNIGILISYNVFLRGGLYNNTFGK